jgi:polysaccharide export outer membrane protein
MPSSMPRLYQAAASCLVAVGLLLLSSPPVLAQAPGSPIVDHQYVLRFGDTLNMRVVENEKLEIKDQPIRPDGRVSLPLVGEIQAGGLTLPQLQERVSKAYSKYFVDPHVVINVEKFRPLAISVVGLVNKPDTFRVDQPMHLLQMIGLAGGVERLRGDLHNVLIARLSGEHQVVDLQAVMEGKVEDNVMLYDGDTVRVLEISGPDWYLILPTIASSLSIATSIILIIINTRSTTTTTK